MTSTHGTLALFVAVGFCLHSAAQDTPCKGVPALQGNQYGYQRRGERCEGLYVANVGARSLAATSFSMGPVRFTLDRAVRLQVTAPGQAQVVNVRAVAIPPKTYYRMDATLPPGGTMVWPVRDVLEPQGLKDSYIGIFAWKGTENGKTLVPVRVVPQGAAAAAAPPLLTIQASFDAQQVKWRFAPMGDSGCLAFGPWQDAIAHPVNASAPIAINLSSLPAGLHCVEAAASSRASRDFVNLTLRVEIPPS